MGQGNTSALGTLVGVVFLAAVVAVALIHNFSDYGVGQTWPVLLVGLGFCVAIAGMIELGLGLAGVFLVWLLANLGVISPFSKSWPFVIIWVIVMVVFGFVRARASAGRAS